MNFICGEGDNMNKQQFYDLCAKHDWYHQMSDDAGVCQRGERERHRLTSNAMSNPDFKAIYEAWCEHMYSGEGWGTEKKPKPIRPES